MIPLPIDPHVQAIRAAVRAHRAAVVIAAPGAGKTTRIPPALCADGPVILLQPRRVAARLLARRIAEEQGFSLGRKWAGTCVSSAVSRRARGCSWPPKASSPRASPRIPC